MDTKKILNLIAFIVLIAGALLKITKLPGAGPALVLSGILIITIIFMFAVKENQEAGMPATLNYVLSGTLAIATLSIVFTFMHWPGGYIIVTISMLINIILTYFLIVMKEPVKLSKQYIITVFLYICLLSSVIAVQAWRDLINVVTH
jgi:sugar phosphate permease